MKNSQIYVDQYKILQDQHMIKLSNNFKLHEQIVQESETMSRKRRHQADCKLLACKASCMTLTAPP